MPPRSASRRSLALYEEKRDFELTPEPGGKSSRRAAGAGAAGADSAKAHGLFVVQKHAARSLHYDFRLEHGGVLLSWAVPKGPSLDPRQRRLAVQVEDHPVSYASFAGEIPAGNYGAGKVEIWDRGTWQPHGDVDEGLRRGKLEFRLIGGKLDGEWHLVRLPPKGDASRSAKANWLLIRAKRTPGARPSPRRASRIVPAGRAGAKSEPIAELFELATLVEKPPDGGDWLHETKWDGYRLLIAKEGGAARIWSRSGTEWTERLPEIAAAAARLRAASAIVDGELVALVKGRSDFQGLQRALGEEPGSKARSALRFLVFDLLTVDGEDLRALPLVERKRRLAALVGKPLRNGLVQLSRHAQGKGAERLEAACVKGLEGIVSKRADAPYRPGRGRDWLKTKCRQRQEFVVVGYTLSRAEGRRELGALLLGVGGESDARRANQRAAANLIYAGRVGTGFDQRARTELLRRLVTLETEQRPVAGAIPATSGVHWVRPQLVAEVQFAEWTSDGRLRHPSFVGLREDKAAGEVRRERPKSAATPTAAVESLEADGAGDGSTVAGITITHPARPLFPGSTLTKLDVARYFAAVWPWMKPHLDGRPLSLVRCPGGARGSCFFQKHWTGRLAGTKEVDVSEPGEHEPPQLAVVDAGGLIGLAQNGVIELHLWGSRLPRLERPDRLVFDLDPGPGVPWKQVVEAARLLRGLLAELGLAGFPLLSGGKGLHVVVPLAGRQDWATVKSFAAAVAHTLATAQPERYVAQASKARRARRIFVDYLRNGREATAIAPYSPRARAGAPAATPISWDELGRSRPDRWTVATLPARLRALPSDPWPAYFTLRQSIPTAALAGLAAGPSGSAANPRRGKMATRKSAKSRRYGEKAGEKVERALHEMKEGKLKSGGSGKKVTSRKQAIAIGLSEARAAGGKVPKAPARKKAAAKKK